MIPGGSGGGWSQPDEDPSPELDLLSERYERRDLIGAGGMGRVFEAYDRVLQRTVALKEVAPHLAGSPAAKRLATEWLLTADLEHPGIVSVHDAGRTEDGRLFYTMRLVRGRSLAERRAQAGSMTEHLALVRHLHDAAHAVGYAHVRGIVHRDLKPANIMVGEFGETQVVDWGLARRVVAGQEPGQGARGGLGPPGDREEQDEEGARGGTDPGGGGGDAESTRAAGTDGYMSPEARLGGAVDARSDVYSLGATLRELLPEGAPPDLQSIADRCLALDPGDRYADAHELALDLGRFLDGRPVSAYAYSPTELLQRLVRLWRAPLAVAAVAGLVLAVTATLAYTRTSAARDRALQAEGEARGAFEQAEQHLASSLQAQAAAAARHGRIPAAQILAAAALLHDESPLARGVLLADLSGSRPLSVDLAPLPDCESLSLSDAGLLCQSARGLELHESPDGPLWTLPGPVSDAIVVGDVVAITRPGHRLELVDRRDGAPISAHAEVPGQHPLQASPWGDRVGLANGQLLTVVEVATGRRWDAAPCGDVASALALGFGPEEAFVVCTDGRITAHRGPGVGRRVTDLSLDFPLPRVLRWADGLLLMGTVKGMLEAVDPTDGEPAGSLQVLEGPVDALVPLVGHRLVAVSGDRGGARIWDREAGVELLRLPAPTRALHAQDAEHLWVVGKDLRRWVLPARPRPRRFQVRTGLTSLALSPDGERLAAAQGDGHVTVWSTDDGRVLAEDLWQERVVKWVTFRPDGSEVLAMGLGDARVRRFSGPEHRLGFSPPTPRRGAWRPWRTVASWPRTTASIWGCWSTGPGPGRRSAGGPRI